VFRCKVITAALLTGLALAQGNVSGQESGQFYKKPQTTTEFWRAMNHEIELGQYKLAASYLHGFLAKNPSDEELLQIQESEGSSAFGRLFNIPELGGEAKGLVDRVNELVQKHLSDRRWLDKLIQNLQASPEERAYAIEKLRRAGALAMPALIETLVRPTADSAQRAAVLGALEGMDVRIVPPLTAALAVDDPMIQGALIDLIRHRADTQAAPFLWYYSEAPKEPEFVHSKAKETLAYFLNERADRLPPAKVALTRLAEDYYRHRMPLAGAVPTTVWQWNGQTLIARDLPAGQAEEFYGLLFVREALELDPTYVPAQIVFLSLAVDKAFERSKPGEPLAKSAPAVQELLNGAGSDLVIVVLENALKDGRVGVILNAVRTIAAQSAVAAVRRDSPSGPILARTLSYPDRRLQIAAADAILGMPQEFQPVQSARVVEILRRTASGEAVAQVLIADPDRVRGEAVAAAVSQAGFAPVVVRTGREAFRRLNDSADIDLVLVHSSIADPQLAFFISQLRASINDGLIPIIVMTPSSSAASADHLGARNRNVAVLQETGAPATFQRAFAAALTAGFGRPLTDSERRDDASRAMEWLAHIARGEVRGYDARPAAPAILKGLHSGDLVNFAVEAAGSLPGPEMQRELAALVLDQNQQEPLRSKATRELCRHIQSFGLSLDTVQIKNLEDLWAGTSDAKLKAGVALVLGSMRPSSALNGARLLRFRPDFSAQLPAQKPK
jgi:CheY-like chemotaxis protein